MRDTTKPLVEHAYELARSGNFSKIDEIRLALMREGFTQAEIRMHLHGPASRTALKQLFKQTRAGQGAARQGLGAVALLLSLAESQVLQCSIRERR